jgi:Tol biopolymer transport system component
MFTTEAHAPAITSPAARLAVVPAVLCVVFAGHAVAADDLAAELKDYPHKIIYETYPDGNWELFVTAADGSEKVNLTRTPDVHELYPHASPDGATIAFVVDKNEHGSKQRSVYIMNRDATGRRRVAANARQHCFSGDGTKLAYLRSESEQFTYTDYATKGIFVYDLATGDHRQHPNKELYHLYNPCWSPAGKWFVATVHAGMGYRHGMLAIDAEGTGVHSLHIPGCRPDISPDGKRIAWGASDWALRVGDLDFSGPKPKVTGARDVVTSPKPMKVYHVDWSPDGKYLAFSRGPERKIMGRIPEIVGVPAKGWNIGVADVTQQNRWIAITTDGKCNKEPDWVPRGGDGR